MYECFTIINDPTRRLQYLQNQRTCTQQYIFIKLKQGEPIQRYLFCRYIELAKNINPETSRELEKATSQYSNLQSKGRLRQQYLQSYSIAVQRDINIYRAGDILPTTNICIYTQRENYRYNDIYDPVMFISRKNIDPARPMSTDLEIYSLQSESIRIVYSIVPIVHDSWYDQDIHYSISIFALCAASQLTYYLHYQRRTAKKQL